MRSLNTACIRTVTMVRIARADVQSDSIDSHYTQLYRLRNNHRVFRHCLRRRRRQQRLCSRPVNVRTCFPVLRRDCSQESNTDRVQKLKEARTQATIEIEAYRKFKEDEFKAFEASVRPPPFVRALFALTSLLAARGQHTKRASCD